jgi:hypothetical protein
VPAEALRVQNRGRRPGGQKQHARRSERLIPKVVKVRRTAKPGAATVVRASQDSSTNELVRQCLISKCAVSWGVQCALRVWWYSPATRAADQPCRTLARIAPISSRHAGDIRL